MRKQIFVGTSGYTYQHWKKVFYPGDLTPKDWFVFYTKHFNTVELNVTFYRLPAKKVFSSWGAKSPKNFKFVIKGSRFITHIKRLKGCQEPLKLLFSRASELKEKLACVLWQLPPSFKCNLDRLSNFIKLIKKNYSFCRHSFEFRHDSWFNDEVYALLKKNDINLCIADSPGYPAHKVLTSPFVYLRFHGGKILYGSQYSKKELNAWAKDAKKWMQNRKQLFAFFNNDAYGFAPKDALTFKDIINEKL